MSRQAFSIFAILALVAVLFTPRTFGQVDASTQQVEIRSVRTLQANQPTDIFGSTRLDVWQRKGDGVLRAVLAGDESRTVALRPEALAQALGVDGASVEAQAVAPLSNTTTLVYVNGWAGNRSMASLQLYSYNTRTFQRLLDAATLASASGMGDSLDIARGQLAVSGQAVWLWLRHVDRSVFFRFDIRLLNSGEARPVRPFLSLSSDEGIPALSPNAILLGRPDGGFWLLDQESDDIPARLWQVDANGRATPADWPEDHPPPSVPPLPLGDGDNAPLLYFFARPRFDPQAAPTGNEGNARYPLLEIRQPGRPPVRYDRDAISFRLGFPLYALRITAWARDRQTGDIVAYDRMSGELLRITLPIRK